MRRFSVAVLPVLLAGFMFSQRAFAWNDTGHKIIASIAWGELQPAVRAKVTELLKKHPQYSVYLEDPKAATPAAGAFSAFLIGATWADMVRTPVGKNRLYNHGTWHYIDLPFVVGVLPEGTAAPEEPVTDWKPGIEPTNAVQAWQKNLAELKDPVAPDEQRAVALTWILHLAGDIQQPLHAVSMYSAEYPTGDRGGNSQMISVGGSVINLHMLWDDMLGRYTDEKIIRELAGKIQREYPREARKDQIKAGDIKAWALESFGEAREVVYLNGKLASLSREKLNADKTAPVPELPKDYLDAAKTLARKKMALGAYRLADCLNEAFGVPAATAPAPAPK